LPVKADSEQRKFFELTEDEELTLYKPNGCSHCNHKGYKGRTGIHELLVINDKVQELIHGEHSEQEIELAIRSTTPSIRQDGLDKVKAGKTTLAEVLRVTKDE
jgi:general secretion pathway protein E